MTSLSSLYLSIGAVVLILILASLWFFYFRYWHIGFGIILTRRESDGTIWVASRLLKSPAGRAGIQNFSRVISIDEVPMCFKSNEDFFTWSAAHRPQRKRTEVWVFEGGLVTHITPSCIRRKIPIYWSINTKCIDTQSMYCSATGSFRRSMGYCSETGQLFFSRKVSTTQLLRTYFD